MNEKTKAQLREFLQLTGLPPHRINEAISEYSRGEKDSEEITRYIREIMYLDREAEFVVIGRIFFNIIEESETSTLQAIRIQDTLIMLQLQSIKLKSRLEKEAEGRR